MNRKLLLVAGIAAAAIALLVLHTWQQRVMETYSPGAEVEVFVAAQDLAAGTRLASKMLTGQSHSQNLLRGIAQPLDRQQVESIEGRTLARPLVKGEIVRMSDFEAEFRIDSLAQKVTEGMRAVPLLVGEINAFSGLVQPGDRIDILVHLPHPRTGQPVVKSLLEQVQILATGDRTTPGEGFGRGGTITLLLSREQAAQVTLAHRSGELIFMLRNPIDQENAGAVEELSVDDLVEPEVQHKPKPAPREVPSIRIAGPQKG